MIYKYFLKKKKKSIHMIHVALGSLLDSKLVLEGSYKKLHYNRKIG